jgi:hypothetical protein
MPFSKLTEFCHHHHNLILEYFITPKGNPVSISIHSPFSPNLTLHDSSPNATTNLLSIHLPVWDISYTCSLYSMWSFVTSFFYLAQCSQGSSMEYHVLVPYCFCGWMIFHYSMPHSAVHHLVGILDAFIFCLLWILPLWTFISKFLFFLSKCWILW